MEKIFFTKCFILAALSISLVSCSKSENDGQGGLFGWYTVLSDVAKTSDFDVINEAIYNHELLSHYTYGGTTHYYYAEYDYFIDENGRYSDTEANAGRLRFTIENPIAAVRIKDDNTILYYTAWLYVDGRSSEEAVYRLYAGPIFNNMTYYGTPQYYSYARSGNKLIVTNGDIFTIVDGSLIKDGSSKLWSKYDPSVVHRN